LRDEITKVNNNFKLVNPTCLLTVLTIWSFTCMQLRLYEFFKINK
jgi:hypothetical protein